VIDGANALAAAFNHDDPAKGERAGWDLVAQLQARWPDAAASLREGLEDRFTVRRLGVGGRLAASLTNTNCIQSMISVARDTTRNVQRWRDGKADQPLVCRRDAQRGTQLPPAQGLPAAADVHRCARLSRRSCSTGMRCCTSRRSGLTDAPPPSGRDAKLDARDDLGPKS
jgi:hypothetical protein